MDEEVVQKATGEALVPVKLEEVEVKVAEVVVGGSIHLQHRKKGNHSCRTCAHCTMRSRTVVAVVVFLLLSQHLSLMHAQLYLLLLEVAAG